MKLASDILYGCRIQDVHGSIQTSVDHVAMDSREVKPMGMFVAVRGTQVDGHDYIQKAIENGAVAIVAEKLPESMPSSVVGIQVNDSSKALGIIAANFYNNPSQRLKVVGVTGTNGKTTTATLMYQLFSKLGFKSGLLSTVKNIIGDKELASTHTTPNAIAINHLMHKMLDAGCTHCFMEVSSHALHQNRVHGINFAGGVFTNITHDHLDYHGTFNEYIKAKRMLFDMLPANAFALINNDDKHGDQMSIATKARVRTFGLKTMADYKAKVLENNLSGLHLNIENMDLFSPIIGSFNASNLLVVYGVAMEMELDQMEVLTQMSTLQPVSGRFQHYSTANNVNAVVDYAHTPDALENVLKTIDNIRTGNEQVITVVGCGGDRDTSKRPLMARIAVNYSTQVVLTSDNPRSEDPNTIINDMKAGLDPVELSKTLSLENRREAIKLACTLAQPGDIILVAGKGHEDYQEINGVKFPFNDSEIIQEHLKALQK
ncbi:MAG: UDP-N-acetylmuramoyl-L-alanyl-D-glutamate--2,6-diaminopimelate ligase [Flavobacteriales bacterium]|nr:UDP-N-acetylmuramoyl-L-alanyl-D-glutamate--2,6-diaminopimelate ligase [Flavobacteriales bacterium]